MITHPSFPAANQSLLAPGCVPASSSKTPLPYAVLSALAGVLAFPSSSLSFLSDVPACIGGAVLSGASKFGAAVAGTSKRGFNAPRMFLFSTVRDWFINRFSDDFYQSVNWRHQ